MSFRFLPNQISVLGFGLGLGQPKIGVASAPQSFVKQGLIEKLQSSCSQRVIFDELIFDLSVKANELASVRNALIGLQLESIFLKAQVELKNQHLTLSLGGDHAIAFATISAAASVFENLKVVWIDAHGDANTPDTSPTKNMHGMPVAGILGHIRNQNGFDWLKHFIKPENIAILGIRSLDDGEKLFLKNNGVCCFSVEEIREKGLDHALSVVSERLRLHEDSAHYLSFDVDAVDPRFAPSTGTPVPDGLHPDEVLKISRWLAEQGHLVGVDCVEVNPKISSQVAAPTLQLCIDMMNEIVLRAAHR